MSAPTTTQLNNMMNDRIIREPERRQITGLGRTAWKQREQDGRAPKRRNLSGKAVGWQLSELQAWVRGEWGPANPTSPQPSPPGAGCKSSGSASPSAG